MTVTHWLSLHLLPHSCVKNHTKKQQEIICSFFTMHAKAPMVPSVSHPSVVIGKTWAVSCYSPGFVLFGTNTFFHPSFFAVSKNRSSGEYPDIWDLCETQMNISNQACEGRICTSWDFSAFFISGQNTNLSNRPSSGRFLDKTILCYLILEVSFSKIT